MSEVFIHPDMMGLGKAEIGVSTFCAASFATEKCGANGLPLTPNSIRILGRFQVLKTLHHPRLCQYLDLVRGKHERVVVVSEHHNRNLATAIRDGAYCEKPDKLVELAYHMLDGLVFINSHGLVHRNISPVNILFDSEGGVKLSKYGLYHMTDAGADVVFPIGQVRYMAPEVLCQGLMQVSSMDHEFTAGWKESRHYSHTPSGPKVDVWSLGILLLEALMGGFMWTKLSLQQTLHVICSFVNVGNPLEKILADHHLREKFKSLPAELQQLIQECLEPSPSKRHTPSDLIKLPVFMELAAKQMAYKNGFSIFSTEVRCKDLDILAFDESIKTTDEEDHLGERTIEEVYYLWQLTGGDLMAVLRKSGLIRSCPPITKMARFSLVSGEYFGEPHDKASLLDETVITLSLDLLRQRLADMDPVAYYPLLEEEKDVTSSLPTSPSSVDLSDTSRLPLVIKEKDVEYQFHRIILYDRLLKGYPHKRAHIWKEARVDIPPLVRSLVWAALLEVEGDVQGRYISIDKETPTPTDRQIEVDIPRCHQYNELLSSPEAHDKFKRVLKAWVVSHPQYVYWQGLDSLCAPFLYLNFNNEAAAYACLSAFIPKYLHKLFLKDNSKVIQEYLAVFTHLIAFHDADLSNHLEGIGFIPDLYAIPWFLTMFAHAFPLHKLFHLWDTLLLGNSSFPLCIGVAILQQLRDQLLSFGFNECILLFSDMPEIDIESCVQDSIRIFCLTPKSATYRQHARPPRQQSQQGDRPNISYYSQDYHEQTHTELSMDPIPVEELKSCRCCRISAEDLIELGELLGPSSPSRSPTKRASPSAKPKIIIIDIRPADDYARGTIPGSINIPFHSAFGPDGNLIHTPAIHKLNSSKVLVKVVVGSRGKNAMNFAESLLHLGFSKVCVLHKGIDILRPTGVLAVPSPDI